MLSLPNPLLRLLGLFYKIKVILEAVSPKKGSLRRGDLFSNALRQEVRPLPGLKYFST